MKLIIQIPCYNEEKTLPQVLSELPKSIPHISSIETLIIDDGSKDNTSGIARKLGVNHILKFKQNRGLARVYKAGIDACLKLGADIIVNTDGDNQYSGSDIPKLVEPIINGTADMVVGIRPIEDIKEFSWIKKRLQRLGSSVVRLLSRTDIPDATSGFRALSREAALQMNIFSDYTYTLEALIQAGENKLKLEYVPIRVNKKTRESRLFRSIPNYIAKSIVTLVRVCITYRPLKYFSYSGGIAFLFGVLVGLRFIYFYFTGYGGGHIQSLILASILLTLGFQLVMFGLLADVVATNRKLSEDIQSRVRNMELRLLSMINKNSAQKN